MRPIDPYITFWETIAPASLDRLDTVFAPEIRFQDPFNDVSGHDALRAVLAPMFKHLDRPRFEVTRAADTGQGVWLLRWDFTCRFRGRNWGFPGMSEVWLNADGLAHAHVDHWDSGTYFYARLPIVGGVVRLIRRKMGQH